MTFPAEKFTKLSLKDIITPRDGRMVHADLWWLVTDSDEVLFFRGSPQCNSNVEICERLRPLYPFHTRSKWIEFAYLPHRCSDYYA